MIEIRRRIKAISKRLLMERLMPAVKLCMLLIVLYLTVFYIKLYASPILVVEGAGISAFIDAYLNMNWKQILSIIVINIFSILIIGPVMCIFAEFFIKVTEKRKQAPGNGHPGEPESNVPVEDEELKVSKYLHWFTESGFRSRAILLRFAVTVLSVLWHVIFIGPPLVLLYFLKGNPNSISYTNKVFIYTTWMLVGYLLTYVKLGTYYPSYFLLARHPQMPIKEVLRDSTKMMRGHAVEFFRYKLSFLPWYALCIVTFGFALLYVVPYRGISDATFIRYIDSVSSEGNLPW
jgi:hypothetical protein